MRDLNHAQTTSPATIRGQTVLYATPGVFDKGGISRYGRYQISALRDLVGTENVSVVSLQGPGSADLESPFSVDYSPGSGRPDRLRFLAHLIRLAAVRRPSIIWVGLINHLAPALLLGSVLRAEVVVNIYGAEIWSPMRRDTEWALRRVSNVVSDCHFTARCLREDFRWRGSSLDVVWDCVDTARFTPGQPDLARLSKYGLTEKRGELVVMILGRMSKATRYKGWHRLLAIAEMLPEPLRVHFVFAGRGDLRGDLEAEVRRRRLAGRVRFTGSVHEDDLADLYRYADVFFLVSEPCPHGGEGIPLTPLEAAGCGVPLLVGNRDGSQEAVENGVNGWIFDPQDLPAQAEAIRKLAVDPELRAAMGRAARLRITRYHSYELFREHHRAILERLAR